MVMDLKVDEFVHNHIVHSLPRGFDEMGVAPRASENVVNKMRLPGCRLASQTARWSATTVLPVPAVLRPITKRP